jgi:hypothetical protein
MVPRPLPGGCPFDLQGAAVGGPVEPAAHGRRLSDLGRLFGQDEEGGLEGVLGVLSVGEDVAADAPNEGAVPLHKGGKGGLVVLNRETFQELGVGPILGGPSGGQVVDVSEEGSQLSGGHGFALSCAVFSL